VSIGSIESVVKLFREAWLADGVPDSIHRAMLYWDPLVQNVVSIRRVPLTSNQWRELKWKEA